MAIGGGGASGHLSGLPPLLFAVEGGEDEGMDDMDMGDEGGDDVTITIPRDLAVQLHSVLADIIGGEEEVDDLEDDLEADDMGDDMGDDMEEDGEDCDYDMDEDEEMPSPPSSPPANQ